MTLACLSPPAWAWGTLGHRLVAAIADTHLTPACRQWLQNIYEAPVDLVAGSTWADRYSGVHPDSKPWHYATWQQGTFVPGPNLIQGLNQAQETLKHPRTHTLHERRLALLWLVHLVGDAHQPLHIGNGHDAGGNLCWVHIQHQGRRRTTWRTVSLHNYWDSQLLNAQHLTLENYRQRLLERPHPSLSSALVQAPPTSWLVESRALHPQVYPSPNREQYCRDRLQPQSNPIHPLNLTPAYAQQALKIMESRIQLAGMRLARLLNQLSKHSV